MHSTEAVDVLASNPKISIVIITLNEEKNIRDCLESVRWADEIIVVDAMSTDKTVEIAREYANKIYERVWEGYSSTRNFGLSQTRGEWVLFLDADERISEILALEIQQVVKENNTVFRGYHMPRQSYYLGRWIRFGEWNPDLKLRLGRRDNVIWVGKIHERILINGRHSFLKHSILHYPYRDIGHHYEKFKRYSSLFAEEALEKGQRSSLSKIILKPSLRFFRGYFIRQGFRDGFPGFVIAAMQAYENFLRYTKLWKLEKNSR